MHGSQDWSSEVTGDTGLSDHPSVQVGRVHEILGTDRTDAEGRRRGDRTTGKSARIGLTVLALVVTATLAWLLTRSPTAGCPAEALPAMRSAPSRLSCSRGLVNTTSTVSSWFQTDTITGRTQ